MGAKVLFVTDMQRDFIYGPLGSNAARAIVDRVKSIINECRKAGWVILFSKDTHPKNYLELREGRYLKVEHCVENTDGWEIIDGLVEDGDIVLTKPTFGGVEIVQYLYSTYGESGIDSVEFVGVCTDICVLANASLVKSFFPETDIIIDAAGCAGSSLKAHFAALTAMKSMQMEVRGLSELPIEDTVQWYMGEMAAATDAMKQLMDKCKGDPTALARVKECADNFESGDKSADNEKLKKEQAELYQAYVIALEADYCDIEDSKLLRERAAQIRRTIRTAWGAYKDHQAAHGDLL